MTKILLFLIFSVFALAESVSLYFPISTTRDHVKGYAFHKCLEYSYDIKQKYKRDLCEIECLSERIKKKVKNADKLFKEIDEYVEKVTSVRLKLWQGNSIFKCLITSEEKKYNDKIDELMEKYCPECKLEPKWEKHELK